jgi:quinol monooxygenase YgiN
VISILQFDVGDDGEARQFVARLELALRMLAERPGYLSGSAGRSTDDPGRWVLVTEWRDVGAYRRSLGGLEMKVHVVPVLSECIDEPTAFEQLLTAEPGQPPISHASDRARDPSADSAR